MFLLKVNPVNGVAFADGDYIEHPQFVNIEMFSSIFVVKRTLDNGTFVKSIVFESIDFSNNGLCLIFNFVIGIKDAEYEFDRIMQVLSSASDTTTTNTMCYH